MAARCIHCGRALRRSAGRRFARWLLGPRPQLRAAQFLLGVVFVIAAYFIITMASGYRLSP
jgi:hypothetical protein